MVDIWPCRIAFLSVPTVRSDQGAAGPGWAGAGAPRASWAARRHRRSAEPVPGAPERARGGRAPRRVRRKARGRPGPRAPQLDSYQAAHQAALPLSFALCPLPFALCPLPFALCPLSFVLCPLPCGGLRCVGGGGEPGAGSERLAASTRIRRNMAFLTKMPHPGRAGSGWRGPSLATAWKPRPAPATRHPRPPGAWQAAAPGEPRPSGRLQACPLG